MNKIVLAMVAGLTLCGWAGEENWQKGPSDAWYVNWEKAKASAQTTHKALYVLNTGSTWCHWCKKLRAEVLENAAFIDFAAKNLTLVYLDNPCENPDQEAHNRRVAREVGFGGGVPHAVVLASDGKRLGEIVGGGRTADEYISELKDILAKAPAAPAKTALFNGRDLTGWTPVLDPSVTGGYAAAEPTWFVKDGTIRTTGTPFGYLKTQRKDYANFRLHVEYRWWRATPKPNSGIFVRIAEERGTFLPTCVENQLCRGSAGDVLGLGDFRFAGYEPAVPFNPKKPLSGISKALRKGKDVEKPFGEWNVLEVTLDGDTLVNCVNGVELNRVTGLSVKSGAIGLQSEGGAAEFRNIWIEEK